MIILELKTVPVRSERKAGSKAFSRLRAPAIHLKLTMNAYFLLCLEWLTRIFNCPSVRYVLSRPPINTLVRICPDEQAAPLGVVLVGLHAVGKRLGQFVTPPQQPGGVS